LVSFFLRCFFAVTVEPLFSFFIVFTGKFLVIFFFGTWMLSSLGILSSIWFGANQIMLVELVAAALLQLQPVINSIVLSDLLREMQTNVDYLEEEKAAP
jgi:hypothetical protein